MVLVGHETLLQTDGCGQLLEVMVGVGVEPGVAVGVTVGVAVGLIISKLTPVLAPAVPDALAPVYGVTVNECNPIVRTVASEHALGIADDESPQRS